MDLSKRRKLIETIREGLPSAEGALPVVTLEEFFVGNDDVGSIGGNLTRHPGINRFFSILKKIRSLEEVQAVLIEVQEVVEADETTWPFSERVFVITSAPLRSVRNWFVDLQPSEIATGVPLPPGAPDPRDGFTLFAAWWD